MHRLLAMVLAGFALAPAAAAQEAEWVRNGDVTTAVLADDGAELLSSSSFIDGRDYISITYWMRGTLRRVMYRCVDRVGSDGVSRRSRCALVIS